MAELNVYKETAVPATVVPNALYLIKEGSNPFFTLRVADSAGTLIPLGFDVLGTILAGYSTGSNTTITAADSIIQAFQKAQGQINSLSSAVAGGIRVPLPLNASGNPNYPAATAGDSYIITVAGRVGGASGEVVQVGDLVNALNNNAGGTQASVGANWYVLEGNKDLATDTVLGIVRRATVSEINSGTDANAYVSPERLRSGVLGTPMLGLSIGSNTAIIATDNLIVAIGKAQAQINAREPSFSKNTGFNRAFGTAVNTVAQGNDSRILNGQTAFDWGNHALAGYVPETRTIGNGAGITGGGNLSSNRTIALTGMALAFHNLSTNGFAVRTAANTVAPRVMTGSDSIAISNGDGVVGNPIFTMQYAGSISW
jgi:hypothetical protein